MSVLIDFSFNLTFNPFKICQITIASADERIFELPERGVNVAICGQCVLAYNFQALFDYF